MALHKAAGWALHEAALRRLHSAGIKAGGGTLVELGKVVKAVRVKNVVATVHYNKYVL